MSWELIRRQVAACPCGKGSLIQNVYEDDWNQIDLGSVEIECLECKKIYKTFTESYPERKPHYGQTERSFLLPINYPNYTGTQVSSVYKTKSDMFNLNNRDFVEYLIVSYPLLELIDTKNQMTQKGSAAKLNRMAKKIAKEHKRQFNSLRLTSILPKVQRAIDNYTQYEGNYQQRLIIQERENAERAAYDKDKKSHSILINFK